MAGVKKQAPTENGKFEGFDDPESLTPGVQKGSADGLQHPKEGGGWHITQLMTTEFRSGQCKVRTKNNYSVDFLLCVEFIPVLGSILCPPVQ